MRVSVVIVNFNGQSLLERCLQALREQTHPADEIVVVDNGSSDGSCDLVRAAFPEVSLVEARANLGFAAGNNLGILRTRGDAVLLLNNDTVPEPEAVAALAAALEADAGAGAASATMVFARRPDVVASAGIDVFRNGLALDHALGQPVASLTGTSEVFGASAGAALYRRTAFDDVGLFPASFFMYLEDVDLAWRMRLRGWRTVHVPGAVVRHDYSASSVEGSPFKRRLLARNRVWMLARCFPTVLLTEDWWRIGAYDLGALAYAVSNGDRASARGRLEGLVALPRRLDERRAIQRGARVDPASLKPWLLPSPGPRDMLRLRALSTEYAVG